MRKGLISFLLYWYEKCASALLTENRQGIILLLSWTCRIPDLKINRLERLSLCCGLLCQGSATTLPGRTYCCNAPTLCPNTRSCFSLSVCQRWGQRHAERITDCSSSGESFRPPSCNIVKVTYAVCLWGLGKRNRRLYQEKSKFENDFYLFIKQMKYPNLLMTQASEKNFHTVKSHVHVSSCQTALLSTVVSSFKLRILNYNMLTPFIQQM